MTSDTNDRALDRGNRRRGDEPFEDRYEIDLNRPLDLLIQNVLGDVAIRATDRPDVRFRSDRSGWADKHGRLQVEASGNRIHVQTGPQWSFDLGGLARGIFGRGKDEADAEFDDWATGEGRRLGHRSGGHRFDLEIEVPAALVETRAKVRAAAGDITVEGIGGSVDVAAASGEIALRSVSGDLTAQSASGDVQVRGATGALKARSASGDLSVEGTDLERVAIQSASGDVSVTKSRLVAGGPFRLDTVSGDVHLDIGVAPAAGELGVRLEFKTVSGDASVAPPLASVGKRTWQVGRGGEGCLQIAVRSVSGDLLARLTMGAAESPVPVGTGAPPPRPAHTSGEDQPAGADDEGPSAWDVIATTTIPAPPIPPIPPTPPMPPFERPDADRIDAEIAAAMAETERAAEAARRAVLDAERETRAAEREARQAEREARDAERVARQVERAAAPAAGDAGLDAATTDPAGGDATRLAVLTALEQGEIDVEEALRRLEPFGDDAGAVLAGETPETSEPR